MAEKDNTFIHRWLNNLYYVLDTPVSFVREKLVEPNQQKYPWYHQQFRRVPNVDECYTDDMVCYTEANVQFFRDKTVEDEILYILRHRYEQCAFYHGQDAHLCDDLRKTYDEALTNWFTKYGDLGVGINVRTAYMKQKHRLIWERRHGPVGSGMKEKPATA